MKDVYEEMRDMLPGVEIAHLSPSAAEAYSMAEAMLTFIDELDDEHRPPKWDELGAVVTAFNKAKRMVSDLEELAAKFSQEESKAYEAWLKGGPIVDLVEAHGRRKAAQTLPHKPLWQSITRDTLDPFKKVGDRFITEWLVGVVDYFTEKIRDAVPLEVVMQFDFGSGFQESNNRMILRGYPQVELWHSQLRTAQRLAEHFRAGRVASLADNDKPGVDKRDAQNPIRYNWDHPLGFMVTRYGGLLKEENLAQWLAAVIRHNLRPTILTGEQVNQRDHEMLTSLPPVRKPLGQNTSTQRAP